MSADELLADLTEAQREAVRSVEGPLLVLAGAGSGKTRVITRRAAYIAREAARPDQVLAITFTNKAAGEMRERIYALTGGGAGSADRRAGAAWGRGRMWVMTFHSLCARLLREYASAAGLSPNYTILDEADRRQVLREAIAACGLSMENWPPRAFEGAISDAKNRLMGPEGCAAEAYDFTTQTVARVYGKYQGMLTEQQACDFDDLLMKMAVLLKESDEVHRELCDRFRYLLIDEYQDTNHAQYVIASRLAEQRRNICATGDPDQSIYAWRGADIRNILEFEADYPEARIVRLEQNFRSTGAILSAASRLISNNERRKHKELWSDGEQGASVRVWTNESEQDEAARIAEDIERRIAEGGEPGDAAIFYRVNALSRVVEDALRRRGIPYQVVRGVAFYQRQEIRDVLAYLRAIENPADETALFRAMGAPARGIGKTTMERIRGRARERGETLDAAMGEVAKGSGAAAKRLAGFIALLAELRAMPRCPVQVVVEAAVTRSGLEAALVEEHGAENERLENVRELVSAARQFDDEVPGAELAEWLTGVSLVSDADALKEGGAVTLMTLHTAKGLEFPAVYVVGLEEGLLPHGRALRGEPDEMEEERRLCFVGMTRAMRELTLSWARHRMVRGITERTLASRFLTELPEAAVERDGPTIERDRSTAHLVRPEDEALEAGAGYYPGQRVMHEDYGEGQVVALEQRGRSAYVRIRFRGHGERSFACAHVALYVME